MSSPGAVSPCARGTLASKQGSTLCLRLLTSKGYGRPVDLVSTPEIAAMLGVSRQRVDQLTRGEGFPEPAAELAIGRVWERADVEAWARETGRLS